MKIKEFKQLLDNNEVFEIFKEDIVNNDIKHDKIIKRIVQYEKYLDIFVKALDKDESDSIGRKLRDYIKVTHPNDKILQTYAKVLADKYNKKSEQVKLDKETKMEEYKQAIKNAKMPLSEVKVLAEKCKSDPEYLNFLTYAVRAQGKSYEDRYSFHFVDLYDHKFAFSAMPRTIEDAINYMKTTYDKGCRLWVSCTEKSEKPMAKNFFYQEPEMLEKVFPGAKVSDEKVIATSKDSIAEIIETTITLINGEKLTVLRYNNWEDMSPIPDEELLENLFSRMDEIKSPLIALNCYGGDGRSGTTGYCYAVRNLINSQEVKEINVLEDICKMREERALMSSRHSILTGLSRTAYYYEQKNK